MECLDWIQILIFVPLVLVGLKAILVGQYWPWQKEKEIICESCLFQIRK